ncbi:hypothetical protein APHAL10511_005840 [Amanita phalloides]|nr:hypothetical protein APHAL10511_005840 [Amanita phalloides]
MSILLDASSPSLLYNGDPYAHHAWNLINRYHAQLNSRVPVPTGGPIFTVPGSTSSESKRDTSIRLVKPTEQNPVGILGAGVGGLYTALILDSLGIPYKMIEARDRVGGRLFTYRFEDPTGGPYNYFDVGAMRFPRIESMRRVFHLFEHCEQVNSGDIQLKAKLRPFYFVGAANNGTFYDYNGVNIKQTDAPNPRGNTFNDADVIQDTSSAPYLNAGVNNITDDVITPFATRLLDDLKTGGQDGWNYLMKYDKYSTRAYMALAYQPSDELLAKYPQLPRSPLPTDVINWCETYDKSTGWYDRALSETVLEAIAFGWQPGGQTRPTEWFLIDGGSNEIAQCMAKYIRSRKPGVIQLNSKVSSIGVSDDGNSVEVVANSKRSTFSHVISTIPLPVLRVIDLSKAKLTNMQANAIRQLNYGPSIKIGMQFQSAWWTTGKDKRDNILNIIGGQTYTDRPLRTVVYPSYGDVQDGNTPVLIASYCWTEDAERFAALIEKDKQSLVRLVLKELAEIHNVTPEFLNNQLLDTFAWSWSNDPYTMGAFAFFGPGKYDDVYKSLTTPAADGCLHFAGEALSARHAWVEGALDSAWRAVEEMLVCIPDSEILRKDFHDKWGFNPEWNLNRPLPADGQKRSKTVFATVPKPENNMVFRHISLSRPGML